jgi:hypothetical protein
VNSLYTYDSSNPHRLRNNLIKKFREISNHLSRDLNSKLQEEEMRREEKRKLQI